MKKSSSLILALSLVASIALVGCGSNTNNSNKKENTTSNQSTTNEQTNTATENKSEKTEFKYYTADQVKNAIENKDDIILLDIQVEKDYEAHHIKGAIPTYAYPAKTDEDKAKIDSSLEKINSSKAPVIIVCPGGAGGAEKTYEYLKEKSVDESRLFILEKGQKAWPYEDLLEK